MNGVDFPVSCMHNQAQILNARSYRICMLLPTISSPPLLHVLQLINNVLGHAELHMFNAHYMLASDMFFVRCVPIASQNYQPSVRVQHTTLGAGP
jgi:hypothetical protein